MKKIFLIAALLLSVGLACSFGRKAAPTATEAPAPTLAVAPTEAPTQPILVPTPTTAAAIPTSEPSKSQIPLPQRGATLFEDDFSTADGGWYIGEEDGNSIKNQTVVLEFFVQKASWLIWTETSKVYASDVVIGVDALLWDGGPTNNYGVMCRYQDADNFYSVSIANDGYVEILKYVGGEATLLYGEMEPLVLEAGPNHLTVSCIGNTIALYLNHSFIVSVEDSSLSDGDVGLIAGTYDEPPVTIRFDNFSAWEPR